MWTIFAYFNYCFWVKNEKLNIFLLFLMSIIHFIYHALAVQRPTEYKSKGQQFKPGMC